MQPYNDKVLEHYENPRNVGSFDATDLCVGTALVGAVLFATLALGEPGTTEVFGRLLQEGPSALANLPAARQAALQSGIASAFRLAFLAIAAFAALGGALAWTIPTRRL